MHTVTGELVNIQTTIQRGRCAVSNSVSVTSSPVVPTLTVGDHILSRRFCPVWEAVPRPQQDNSSEVVQTQTWTGAAARLVQSLLCLAYMKPQVLDPAQKTERVVLICNLSTRAVWAGESEILGNPWLHREVKVCLGYMRTHRKTEKKTTTKQSKNKANKMRETETEKQSGGGKATTTHGGQIRTLN